MKSLRLAVVDRQPFAKTGLAQQIVGRRMVETFRLEEHHLRLLTELRVTWNDDGFGAPCVDSKRPFGHSMGIYDDLAFRIGMEDFDNTDETQKRKLMVIWREMRQVLQIVIDCGHYPAGTMFQRSSDENGRRWRVARIGPGSRIFVGREVQGDK